MLTPRQRAGISGAYDVGRQRGLQAGHGVHNPYLGQAHETCGRVMVGDRSR